MRRRGRDGVVVGLGARVVAEMVERVGVNTTVYEYGVWHMDMDLGIVMG